MSQNRWSPTLPSFGGRLCPRVELPPGIPGDYTSKLEAYYLERNSSPNIFTCGVSRRWLAQQCQHNLLKHYQVVHLKHLGGPILYKYLLSGLGLTMSLNFQRKLSEICLRKDIGTIKRWFQTTDGVVLPLLLSVENPDAHYGDIDALVKFSLENCANNYSHFISRMKSLKRLLRRDYALDQSSAKALTDVSTYRKMYLKHLPDGGRDPHRDVQYLMCWTQTRASGLADQKMIAKSLAKCEKTLSTIRREPTFTPEVRRYDRWIQPPGTPILNGEILQEMSWSIASKIRGETAHISAGPNGCLEVTRQSGGQTQGISLVCRKPCLRGVYNMHTLELRKFPEARPARSSEEVVSWAIQEALTSPTYVRCVRLHAVAEPSKARTITVCSLPYLIIVGVLAKILQPAIATDISRGGLHASRNLWNFLWEDLDPTSDLWFRIRDETDECGKKLTTPILGLSSDLEEATDYGDLGVARQVLHGVLTACSTVPGFPVGLALLAKTLFIGKRFCFRYETKGVRWFTKHNGWLMGDRLTKVILTFAHELALRASGLYVSRICGDDVAALSRSRERLEKYRKTILEYGFKISEEDYYISSKLLFYCEEASLVPQAFQELPAVAIRRKSSTSCYVDYVRIRLLIPTVTEQASHSYTDIGRFSLLGKETRWVHQNGTHRTVSLFNRGQMLQHLSVPMPSDTMCPFTPLEIGGDGAFPRGPTLLQAIVEKKSRNYYETVFRLNAILTGKWGYRLVRNANLDNVVHKYHTLVPKLAELKEVLETRRPQALVEGNEKLLNSIKISGVESPERTFFRLWRAWYWHQILQGKEPPELKLEVTREANLPHTELEGFDFQYFHTVWKDLGFTYENNPDYLVITKEVHAEDYMNMGWWFGKPTIRPQISLEDLGARFLLNEENMESFIRHIQSNQELDPKIKETLHRYVEADSYLKWEISKKEPSCVKAAYLLVSTDRKLAVELARILRGKRPDIKPLVCVVSPQHYLYGMMSTYEEWATSVDPEVETIVDFGSVNYVQFTMDPNFEFFDQPVVVAKWIYDNPSLRAIDTKLEELADNPQHEVWSLTTQPPEQYRPGFRYIKWRSET